MTCIATDGRTMAGDGLITNANLIVASDARKVRRLANGSIVGCAGEWGLCELVFGWFEKGEDNETIPAVRSRGDDGDTALEALILRPDGMVEIMDDNFAPYRVDCPAAIGVGAEIAIGLMLAGKTPREAVEAVVRRVTGVGGQIVEEKSKGVRA